MTKRPQSQKNAAQSRDSFPLKTCAEEEVRAAWFHVSEDTTWMSQSLCPLQLIKPFSSVHFSRISLSSEQSAPPHLLLPELHSV